MLTTRKGLLLILFFALFAFGREAYELSPLAHPEEVRIDDRARTHILYGDSRGGGHRHGAGRPCKSEFPQSWQDDDIIGTVRSMAANDNLGWRKQDNGYYVAEAYERDVKVRVVLDRERDDVVTAYPVNVPRNPCPRKPSNDNYND